MDEENPTLVPRDARTIEAILKSMGVEEYDPRVVQQLLEFLYRYVTTILTDSRQFADHADKQQIDVDDIKLAIRSRCNHSFTQPPPRDVTMRLAAERNSIPLPPVSTTAGVALPPKDYQLTAQNYDVVIDPAAHSSPKRPRVVSPRKSPGAKSPKSPKSGASPRKASANSPAKSTSQQRAAHTSPSTQQRQVDPDVMIIDPPPKAVGSSTPPVTTATPPAVTPVAAGTGTSTANPSTLGASSSTANVPRTTDTQQDVSPEIVDLDAPSNS